MIDLSVRNNTLLINTMHIVIALTLTFMNYQYAYLTNMLICIAPCWRTITTTPWESGITREDDNSEYHHTPSFLNQTDLHTRSP